MLFHATNNKQKSEGFLVSLPNIHADGGALFKISVMFEWVLRLKKLENARNAT